MNTIHFWYEFDIKRLKFHHINCLSERWLQLTGKIYFLAGHGGGHGGLGFSGSAANAGAQSFNCIIEIKKNHNFF